MADEGGIAILGLLDIQRLRITRAFFGIVRGECCEEVEDPPSLGEGWDLDWLADCLPRACWYVTALPDGQRCWLKRGA